MKIFPVFGVIVTCVFGRQGFGPEVQDWDFVNVRPGAYKFWWLYETTAPVTNITEKPLVIWLQGGPGASSTGFGNFAEIGPLDENLNVRNYTWVKDVNLLFIDNPVGTGYSYVEKPGAYTTNNTQIARDLITCLEGFYRKRSEFRTVPLYITSESYGGKMAVEFALELYKRIQNGTMNSNLKGINIIDAWISPIDSVLTWAPFLLFAGTIDQRGYEKIDKAAQNTKALFQAGKFTDATNAWAQTENVIQRVSKNVDFYNILKKIKTSCSSRKGRMRTKRGMIDDCQDEVDAKLEVLMNGVVKKALNVSSNWNSQSETVFNRLSDEFMKPVTHIVEELLNTTTLKIQVVTGQLDLIVDTAGTLLWIDRLKWNGSKNWPDAPRTLISVKNTNEGYKKVLGNFSVYWVNRSGHMVPTDNPAAMASILEDLFR